MIQVQLKLRPTKAQERALNRWLWHLTGVWNWTVKTLEHEPKLSFYDLKNRIKGHSVRLGIANTAISGTIQTAHTSWRRMIRGISGRPRLKGARRPLSCISFDCWYTRPRGHRITVPIIGLTRFHPQEIPAGHVGTARIVRRASGWYLCLLVQAEPEAIPAVGDGQVGIDPGFSSLMTLSTGEKIEHPHEWQQGEARLGQAQRGNRKHLAARLQERIANRRKNRNHHLSRRLVAENGLIAFSADSHRAIARRFGKSVTSSGHSQLRSMLAHKSRTGGREYIEVPSRHSTRTCSACGALTGPTGLAGLKVRQWTCGCGADHERDVNAARNTLIAGLGMSLKNRREAMSGTALLATLRNPTIPAEYFPRSTAQGEGPRQ